LSLSNQIMLYNIGVKMREVNVEKQIAAMFER
jgi:hypothetical protein